MRSIRSSALCAGALLLCAAAAPDEPEVRRAAAMLDYVARGYGLAVQGGRVVNAPEYDEQQAFAQEAGDVLDRLAAMKRFVPEARAVESLVRGKADAQAVSARAAALGRAVLQAAGLSTLPPVDVYPGRGRALYAESCAACHGETGRGDGPAAPELPTKSTDFTAPESADLTPYRVYSAITWGVPQTSMPSYEAMSEEQRWEIAIASLAFGHDEAEARRGERLAREKGLVEGRREWVAKSDAELRTELAARGSTQDDVRALVAWARLIAPFAGPPPAGFPLLTTEVALSSVSYVQKRPAEAEDRLREAQLGSWTALEPLVRAVAPARIAPVREGFATARERVAATGPNERVLLAVAQLAKRIAEAGPEELPDPPALRSAGRIAALREVAPAVLAIAGALLLALASERRWLAAWSLALPAAAAAACARQDLGWRAALALEWAAAAAALAAAVAILLVRRRGSLAAPLAAGLATAAAAAGTARCCAAVLSIFPGAPPDMAQAALVAGVVSCGGAALLGALAGVALPGRASRALAAVALAAAAASSTVPAARASWIARHAVAGVR